MRDKLVAVVSSLDDAGVARSQLTLRADGTLDHFGDPTIGIDTLALILRVGPAKLAAMRSVTSEVKRP